MSRITSHVTLAAMVALGSFRFNTPAGNATTDAGGGAPPPQPQQQQTPEGLREEFSRLRGEAEGVITAATTGNRELTAEEQAANDRRFSRMTAIQNILGEQARFAALSLPQSATAPANRVQTPADAPGREQFSQAEGQGLQIAPGASIVVLQSGSARMSADRQEFSRAMTNWARTGDMDRKFATITTATSSGAMMPKMIGEPIVPTHANPFRVAMGLYGMRPIQTATTAKLTIPVLDASAGSTVDEDANSETENAPSLAQSIVLDPSVYQSGTAWLSNMQLEANEFDVTTYVDTDLEYAKEQAFEAAITAALIADAGITNVVTTATTTGFTLANLVSLNRALPAKYDRLKVILLDGAAFAAAEGLTENGVFVLQPDPTNPQILRFRGTPVLRADSFEAMTANKTIGAVVSLGGFRIRDAGPRRLTRHTQASKPDQTGFNLVGYHAYGWADSAVAKFKTAAS